MLRNGAVPGVCAHSVRRCQLWLCGAYRSTGIVSEKQWRYASKELLTGEEASVLGCFDTIETNKLNIQQENHSSRLERWRRLSTSGSCSPVWERWNTSLTGGSGGWI